jgi:hypothetical protein
MLLAFKENLSAKLFLVIQWFLQSGAFECHLSPLLILVVLCRRLLASSESDSLVALALPTQYEDPACHRARKYGYLTCDCAQRWPTRALILSKVLKPLS